jgi:hypothetical protein
MSWITRSILRATLASCALAWTVGLAAGPAAAADEDLVKYYTVTASYNGAPENLTEIATRFLGSGDRSADLFNLNTGRRQPDGGVLLDPQRLTKGWLLVLPYDAVGTGVQYGALPDKPASSRVTRAVPAPSAGTAGRDTTGPAGAPATEPGGRAPSGAELAQAGKLPASPPPKPKAGKKGECARAAASSARSDWATLRVAADQAWPHSRGKGQLVAVVDSGVDGRLRQLSGHVTVGMDIVGGSGRGDTDCLGTGTAMAALIAAQGGTGRVRGVAPDATVMPVRVVTNGTRSAPADAAAAISAAANAGATVVAVGSSVDTTDAGVAKAINEAFRRDVVVVVAAPLKAQPNNPDAQIGDVSLRVGGISANTETAAEYRSGAVDVVAPGVNVGSVGITGVGAVSGTGTQYAVAFVAGSAALVRAAYPDLDAKQVAHRVRVTARKLADGAQPDGRFGWGLINPVASVTKVLPEESAPRPATATASGFTPAASGGRTTLMVVVALVALAAAGLLIFRVRRMLTDGRYDPDDPEPDAASDDPDLPSVADLPAVPRPASAPATADGAADRPATDRTPDSDQSTEDRSPAGAKSPAGGSVAP